MVQGDKMVELESETFSALGLYDSSSRGISRTPPRVLSLFSSILESSIQRNERSLKASRKEVVTIFHGSRAPSLSIRHYIERIFRYSSCSPSSLVLAYVYMDRFLQRIDASLTSLIAHRLLLTSIMVAAKFIDDECYNNAYYAKVGGVSTADMNNLEMKFLFTLDFKLHVTTEVFRNYCLQLEMEGAGDRRIIQLKQGDRRIIQLKQAYRPMIDQLKQVNQPEKDWPNRGKTLGTSYSFRGKEQKQFL